jgi:hypothetical protein
MKEKVRLAYVYWDNRRPSTIEITKKNKKKHSEDQGMRMQILFIAAEAGRGAAERSKHTNQQERRL